MTDTNAGSPSPAAATSDLARAILTSSARSYAKASHLLQPLGELRLPGSVAVGDMVCMVHQGVRHDFCILRRDWIAEEGKLRLEVLLDHPARGSRAR